MKIKTVGTLIAVILVFAVFVVTPVSAQSLLTNGGFETGDTSGWTAVIPPGGSVNVVTSCTGDQGKSYDPVEGNYFARVKPNGPGSYTTLSQTISLSAGQTIKGYAAFDARDYLPYNDNAAVRIKDSSNNVVATPWYSDVDTVGDYGDGPWTYWEWTAPTDGSYTLELRTVNIGDAVVDSYALFDGISVTGTEPIPEFSTIALPVASILGLLFFFNHRKHRKE